MLYNSKGYARLHHLTQQQIQAIKRSQITPKPQNSTKSPYVRVYPEREEVENSGIKFKSPPRGLRPPRKIIPPRTPKFDLGGMEQKSLTQEDVRQWVKEQNALGHKTKYIPAQTTLRDKDESPQETKGGEQRSFRKEERTPRKQANPRKLRVKENDAQNLKPVPVQLMSSQVREESLEELQSGEQITNTVYSPRIGNIKELQNTEQYLYKPEYQINGVQGVNQTINMDTREKGIYQFRDQSEYIRPVDPEVIYKREPARIAIRKKILQHEKHPIKHPEEGLGKTHPFLIKELKKPIRLQKVPGYFPTKEDWERAIKRVVASRGGRKKGKTQRTSKTSKHQSSHQEGDLLRKDHPNHLEWDRELEQEEEMILEILMNLMIVGWEIDRMKRMRMRQKLKQKEKFHKRNSLNHCVDKLSIEYVFQLNLWAYHPIKQGDLINQLGGEEEEILLLHLPLLVEEVMKGGKEKYLKDLDGSIWYKDLQGLLDKMAEMVLVHHCTCPMTNSKYYYQFGHLCSRTII